MPEQVEVVHTELRKTTREQGNTEELGCSSPAIGLKIQKRRT